MKVAMQAAGAARTTVESQLSKVAFLDFCDYLLHWHHVREKAAFSSQGNNAGMTSASSGLQNHSIRLAVVAHRSRVGKATLCLAVILHWDIS